MINTCAGVYSGGAGAGCGADTVGRCCTISTTISTSRIAGWRPVIVRRRQQVAQRKACLWHKRPYLFKDVAVDRLLWLLLHGSEESL